MPLAAIRAIDRRQAVQGGRAMTKLVYSIGELRDVIGLAKWTVYDLIKKDQFPRPVQLSPGRVGWRATDIQRWIAERPTTAETPEA